MGFMDSLSKAAKVIGDTVHEGVETVKAKTQELMGQPNATAGGDGIAEWYYLAEGNKREGPVTLLQLREMLTSGKLKPACFVAKAGMPNWQPAEKVAELTAKPPTSSADWYYTKDGKKRIGPVSFSDLQKLVGDGVIQSEDMIMKPGVNKWMPASAFPKLFPSVVPVDAAPVAPAPPPKLKEDAPARPPKSKAAAPPAPPVRLKNLKERKAAHVTDTGVLVRSEFTAIWNGLEQTGLAADELVFFCNTQTRLAASIGESLLNLFASKQTEPPVLHLALTTKEWAVLHVGENEKPVLANRGTFEQLTWSFALVEDGVISSALSFFQSQPQAKAPPADVLTLSAGEGEIPLNLLHGDGLTQLKRTLPRLLLDRVRVYVEEGKCVIAESLLDRIVGDGIAGKEAESLKQHIGAVAQIAVEYQGGHPGFPDKAVGVLQLDSLGLEFFVPETGLSMRLPLSAIRAIQPPRQGRYPRELVERVKSERESALRSLRLAQQGMRSRNAALRMTAKISAQSARQRYAAATLGPAPTNRLGVICVVDDRKFKMVFDAAGPTTEFIDEQASLFSSQSATISDRFGQGVAPPKATAKPVKASAIVGCPRCQARLRADEPGVIECPQCQAKIRVAAEKFKA